MAKTLYMDVTPTHDEIAAQAYEIYLRDGCVAGRELEHWLQAEGELRTPSTNENARDHIELEPRPSARGNSISTRRGGKR